MTHWGWYWKIKNQHIPKTLCSQLPRVDSFFVAQQAQKQQQGVPDHCTIMHNGLTQNIIIEHKACFYGGFRHFFLCPQCSQCKRMLYISTRIACRSCLRLGYHTQRLAPSGRSLARQAKIEQKLRRHDGTINNKPPRMHSRTWNKLVNTARKENIAYEELLCRELRLYYPRFAYIIG